MAATTAQMAPEWLVFDCSANLIITDRYNERAYAITTSGIFHCIAGIGGSGSFGGDGGPATAASLDPGGASFDPCWNLYIPDIDNVRIRKITYHSPCYLDSIALNTNQNLLSSEIAIYPNPANSLLTIESTTKLKQIIITNVVGQTVYSQACSLTKVEVNIASQPQGVYIVSVSDEAGKTTIEKVIKQ